MREREGQLFTCQPSPDVALRIEFWADVICSWCGIANDRLNRAVAAVDRDVEIVHRSFRLLPDLPDYESFDFVEYMTRERGATREGLAATANYVEDIARQDGIKPYNVLARTVGNTTLAHEFLAFAGTCGSSHESWDAVFKQSFGRSAPIWTVDDLLVFATLLGLDSDATEHALRSRTFQARVEEDHAEALALGAPAVPFLVIDRRYALSGAQSIETITGAIERAWTDRVEVGA